MKIKKVLVIDDEEEILELLKARLTSQGFSVLLANNAKEGMQLAEKELPNVILLDLMMPGIDGFQTCQWLKSNQKTREIPIVILTALGEEESVKKVKELGIISYIVKPFASEMLMDAIGQAFKK